MSFKRLWAMLHARNLEFFRDRSALGWNFLFPFLIVAGFGIMFGGKDYSEYKVGVFPSQSEIVSMNDIDLPSGFKETRLIKFIGFMSFEDGAERLKHHKIDFLVSGHVFGDVSVPKSFVPIPKGSAGKVLGRHCCDPVALNCGRFPPIQLNRAADPPPLKPL